MNRRMILLAAGAVIAVDQLTKSLARTLPLCTTGDEPACTGGPFTGTLEFLRVENEGTSAFMAQIPIVGLLVTLAGLCLLLFYFLRSSRTGASTLLVGLQLGGVMGNLVDRTLFGAVTDFIAVAGIYVFNLADVAIVTGSLAFLCIGFRSNTSQIRVAAGQDSQNCVTCEVLPAAVGDV